MNPPKERPILFSGPMVKAIMNGGKRQTRRAVKVRHEYRHELDERGLFYENTYGEWDQEPCPYGKPGEMLWVRETWSPDCRGVYPCPKFWYRADFDNFDDPSREVLHRCPKENRGNWADCFACAKDSSGFRWRPSIHMPRSASRITLMIEAVRIERLQEISEDDAREEGITQGAYPDHECGWQADDRARLSGGFAALWEAINGAGSWGENPWVWVVEFRRLA